MVKLTDEQLRELDRVSGQRWTVVDPRSSIQYVLIFRTEFDNLEQDLAEEADLQRFMTSAARRLFQSLDQEEAEEPAPA